MSARILVLPSGRLVWASDPYPGSMHDVAAPDASGLLDGIDPFGWIADKGYIGRGMITPHKKPQRRAERGGEGGEQEHQPDPSDRKSGPSPTSSPGESTRTDYRRPLHNSSKPSPPHSHLSCTVWGGFVFWVGFFDGAGGVVVVGH
ncbi:transposase family protein [Actinomyces dentalis]|uniref:transposase family protein n=1 Tax=Actinomyces dentalis TaxID=272548 RepID=UPI00235321AE|nr:transposase family protein [Actinomyces dentalis]